jgi:hypothetical protein
MRNKIKKIILNLSENGFFHECDKSIINNFYIKTFIIHCIKINQISCINQVLMSLYKTYNKTPHIFFNDTLIHGTEKEKIYLNKISTRFYKDYIKVLKEHKYYNKYISMADFKTAMQNMQLFSFLRDETDLSLWSVDKLFFEKYFLPYKKK